MRKRVLDRFGNAKLEHDDVCLPSDEGEPVADKRHTESSSNPLQSTKLPASIQQSMCHAKVQSYFDDESSYSKSPGVNDNSLVLVKTSSSERPHFVTKKGSSYECDSECLMFKSTNGLSLLVASLKGELDSFVTHYVKTKDPVNYAAMGQHGLPTGGKKPSSRRKASSRNATSAVKSILAAADDISRTKRAPVALSVSNPQDQGNFQSAVYGVQANTINFSTPPLLLHSSPGSSTQPMTQLSNVHCTASDSSVGQLNARISRCQGCRGRIEPALVILFCSTRSTFFSRIRELEIGKCQRT